MKLSRTYGEGGVKCIFCQKGNVFSISAVITLASIILRLENECQLILATLKFPCYLAFLCSKKQWFLFHLSRWSFIVCLKQKQKKTLTSILSSTKEWSELPLEFSLSCSPETMPRMSACRRATWVFSWNISCSASSLGNLQWPVTR